MLINRWFIRCTHCLSVAAVETQPASNWQCNICGGPIETMGRVERDRLVRIEIRCACDARCTGARGPLCECSCGGVNHGTGRTVAVTIDCGPVPVVQFINSDKARTECAAYLTAKHGLTVELQALRSRRAAGQFLPSVDFGRMLTLERAIMKARKARTHATRMKYFTSVSK